MDIENLSDYLSIKTNIWGPSAWFFLHNVVMAYPKKINNNDPIDLKIKNSMFLFLNNLGNILPCSICGESYNSYIRMKEYDISSALVGRKELVYWLYTIHEKVNNKLGVPKCNRLSLQETIDKYSKFIATGCKATTNKEKIEQRLQGCTDDDFKDYKCTINIKENNDNDKNYLNFNKLHIIILILIIIIIYLLCKNNYSLK